MYLLTACKTVSVKKYFRIYDNEDIVYKFQKDSLGIKSYYDDTLATKIIVRRGVFPNHYDQNFNLFYFDKSDLSNSPKELSPFYNFTYCFDNGKLYIGQNLSRFSNPLYYSRFKLLIPGKIKKGENFIFEGSDYKSIFNFVGIEDYKWHNLPTLKCLKFSITEVYSNKVYYIWLAKKWGLVKWINPNGEEGIMYK